MAVAPSKPIKPRKTIIRARHKRTTTRARAVFLEELSLTANVTAAAKRARYTASAMYHHRRGDPAFRQAWHAALCEGYARLETELLAEALAAPDPELGDAEVKARQYRQKLALALLSAHRASVRGERSVAAAPIADETKGAKARLIDKLESMRQRRAQAAAESSEDRAE